MDVLLLLSEVASELNKEGIETEIFRLKPAAAVVSARRAGTTVTVDQINKYFMMNQMPIISSRYWNMVYGSNALEVKKDLEGMQIMRILGRNMAYYLKAMDIAKKSRLEVPEIEETIYTNFIIIYFYLLLEILINLKLLFY